MDYIPAEISLVGLAQWSRWCEVRAKLFRLRFLWNWYSSTLWLRASVHTVDIGLPHGNGLSSDPCFLNDYSLSLFFFFLFYFCFVLFVSLACPQNRLCLAATPFTQVTEYYSGDYGVRHSENLISINSRLTILSVYLEILKKKKEIWCPFPLSPFPHITSLSSRQSDERSKTD